MEVLPMWRMGPKSTNAAVSEGRIRSIGGIFASSTEAPAPRFAGGQPARINVKIYNIYMHISAMFAPDKA